ncbi:MAG: aspartate 1-decarboxylase [Deltaproteobacteria bacterium]|nr:aspartate 1-decarboxylase [Deltaproteobacteria bacterium]
MKTTRRLLGSKIHRATVTDANIEYEGSVTIDAAAAHRSKPGDPVIMASWSDVPDSEARSWQARRVFVDGQNEIRD